MTGQRGDEPRLDPWLVLRTRSHHENLVERSLRQKEINSYLPRHRVARGSKNGRTPLGAPLFRGYVFVQPRPDQLDKVRCIRGSCGFVMLGSEPAAMPLKDLEAVRILAESGADLAVTPALTPGQRVEVIAGPFMGVRGEIIRAKSQVRLVINAFLVSSSVSVEVDWDEIAIFSEGQPNGQHRFHRPVPDPHVVATRSLR